MTNTLDGLFGFRLSAGKRDFSLLQNIQTGSWVIQPSNRRVTGGVPSAGVKQPGREDDHTHFHLIPRLKLPPCPLNVVMAWTGTNALFTLLLNEVPSEGGAKCDPRCVWLAERTLTAPTDRNWLQHTNRMPRIRLPGILKNYRNQGSHLQGYLDAWDRNGSKRGPILC